MSETKVKVEFNKIQLQTVPSREFTSSGLYQFIYTDKQVLSYQWSSVAAALANCWLQPEPQSAAIPAEPSCASLKLPF